IDLPMSGGDHAAAGTRTIASGYAFDRLASSLAVLFGKSKDVGGFLAKVPLAPEAPRPRHDIGCRGADHVGLAVVQGQFGTAASGQDDVAYRRVIDRLGPDAWRRFGREGCASIEKRPASSPIRRLLKGMRGA